MTFTNVLLLTTSFCSSTVVPTLRLLVRLSAYIHPDFCCRVPCACFGLQYRDVYQLAETILAFDNVVATADTTYY